MLEYLELKTFCSVATHLNFTHASKELAVSAPQLSKIIAKLEDKIHCKLFHRTTRSVQLTSEGHSFLTIAQNTLNSIDEASQFFDTKVQNKDLTGHIRITAPNTFGVRFLSEPLLEFHRRFPMVTVEILLEDQYQDLIENNIDIAIRVMRPIDTSLVARKIFENKVYIYGSPDYIKKNGTPKSIDDLYRHPILSIPPHLKLKFSKTKKTIQDYIQRPKFSCTNGDLLVDLAQKGFGLVLRSEWSVRKEVKEGFLVPIDINDVLVSETEIYAVYQKHKYSARRIKGLIDSLIKYSIKHI